MHIGQKVFLINPKFKRFPRVSHPEWTGPYTITKILQNGTVYIKNEGAGLIFAVEELELKPMWDKSDGVKEWVDFDPPPPDD